MTDYRVIPIPGYEGYHADTDGRIWTSRRGYWRRIGVWLNTKGYPFIRVTCGNRRITKTVHSLIARAFHGEPKPGMEVRHLNGIRTDNRPENLAWGTSKENAADRTRHGRAFRPLGDLNPQRRYPERTARGDRSPARLHPESYRGHSTKLTDGDVRTIRNELALGMSQTVVARQFGISQASVSAIATGKSWGWLE